MGVVGDGGDMICVVVVVMVEYCFGNVGSFCMFGEEFVDFVGFGGFVIFE